MVKVGLLDQTCSHLAGLSVNGSSHIQWVRNQNMPIQFFTDTCLTAAEYIICKRKIGILLEPKLISPLAYKLIRIHHEWFDYVLTYDQELIESDPRKFLWIPASTSWIRREDMKLYPKTKFMCMIASSKDFTPNQIIRRELIQSLSEVIDVYGRGWNGILEMPSKLDALKDYMYCIEVENSCQDWYFTEKLLDPMAVGTIPIYYEPKDILGGTDKFFDEEGIMFFDSCSDVLWTLEDKDKYIQEYERALPNIINNLAIVKSMYYSLDDYIFTNYPFLFEE